ncbi:hypothetical protein ACFLTM_05990, partial [Candidatus Bipolaricaulota bacterium]
MNARTWLVVVVCVFGCAVGAFGSGGFTGSWCAEISLSPQQTMPFTAFQSTLDVGLRLDFLTVSSISDFIFDGWLWQEFDVELAVGPLSFSGQLLFEPQTGSFLYAQGMIALEFLPLRFALYGAMVGETQSDSANYGYVVDVYGELFGGLMTFESATFLSADLSEITFTATGVQTDSTLIYKTFLTDPTIDTLPITFSGQELSFSARVLNWAQLTSVTTFSKTGFESEELELTLINLFGSPFTLTLDIEFTLQTKSRTFTPSLDSSYGCVSLYTSMVQSGSSTITGLEIYGVAFEISIGGSTLRSISNLDTTQYVITTPAFGSIVEPLTEAIAEGHLYYPQDYWEVVSLIVDIPPIGCGFSFSVDTFFSTSTGLLFDWAQSTMGVTLAFGSTV